MYIFEFDTISKNLESPEISDLKVVSRFFRCSIEMQNILKQIALEGRVLVKEEGVKKGVQIIEWLLSSPFVVKNDFDFRCEPLYSMIKSTKEGVEVTGSNSIFYKILKDILMKYSLPEVFFKNENTCTFFSYWLRENKPCEIKFMYDDLRGLLGLKKAYYRSFSHHGRVLSTIQNDLKGWGIEMIFKKYIKKKGLNSSSGVIIKITEAGKNENNGDS